MITNGQKVNISMSFLINAGSKKVHVVGEVPGAGQTKFHPEIIDNVISFNEMTKNP